MRGMTVNSGGAQCPSMLPFPHIAEQESRTFPLLDLLVPSGDAIAAVMPIDVFERLVARVAHPAMHLHGAIGASQHRRFAQNCTSTPLSESLCSTARCVSLSISTRSFEEQPPAFPPAVASSTSGHWIACFPPAAGRTAALARVLHAFLDAVHRGAQRTRRLPDAVFMHEALRQRQPAPISPNSASSGTNTSVKLTRGDRSAC